MEHEPGGLTASRPGKSPTSGLRLSIPNTGNPSLSPPCPPERAVRGRSEGRLAGAWQTQQGWAGAPEVCGARQLGPAVPRMPGNQCPASAAVMT